MIDFHSHVIHDIDDGSHSVEESITMMKMELQPGDRYHGIHTSLPIGRT